MDDVASYHFNWHDNVCLVPISLLLTKPIINAAKQADANLKSLKIKLQPRRRRISENTTCS